MSRRRVWKAKYLWREKAGFSAASESDSWVNVLAQNVQEAAAKATRAARRACKADGYIFIRIFSLKSRGAIS